MSSFTGVLKVNYGGLNENEIGDGREKDTTYMSSNSVVP